MSELYSNTKYVTWLKEQARLKRPYWYGTYHNACTESRLQRKKSQYPSHYSNSRLARYRQDISNGQVSGDCVGAAIKGAAWTLLDTKSMSYASNGVPDRSADGMFSFAKNKGADYGAIDSIPDIPGIAVRFAGHVGVYVGNGDVVEWRGFAYGCVVTKLKSRPWTDWYTLPWVRYENSETPPQPDVKTLGSRLLVKGRKGEDVEMLQGLLVGLGYDLGNYGKNKDGVDGDYGDMTVSAVRAFQKREGLTADGKYGEKSHAALMSIIAEQDRDEEDDEVITPTKQIRVTGGRVYVREGASTAYKILTIVSQGDVLPWVATAQNGWHSTVVNGKAGWISGKYSVVE